MPVPLGAKSKLYFNVESTPGELATFSSSRGLRLFFSQFVVDESLDPFTVGFRDKYATPHHNYYARSGYRVGARLTMPKRYYGGYAVLNGAALGELTSSLVGSQWQHDSNMHPDFPSLSFLAQIPIGDGTDSEFQLTGAKVSRFRIRHQVNKPMQEDYQLVGTGLKWVDSLSTVPSLANGFGPDVANEPFIDWSHLTTFVTSPTGGNPHYLRVRGWEAVVDNAASQYYTTGSSIKPKPCYRGGPRRLTCRFDVEMDEEWEGFQEETFGAEADTAEPANLGWTMVYINPSAPTTHWFVNDGDYGHVLARWQGIDGPGGQYARLEYQVLRLGATSTGISLITMNTTSGPSGWDNYGNII